MGQDSVLSLILSTLYLAPVLYILEKCLKILKIPVSILSFVDNGLLIAQSKSLTILNDFLFCNYGVTSSLLEKFGLILEYEKMEVFYFHRLHRVIDPSPLNLSILGGLILYPRNTWKCLGFIFDRKLSFYHYIYYYVNKAILTVKCMKILRNLVYSLIPH